MGWVNIGVAAVGVIGGAASARSAKNGAQDAADAQVAGSDRAIAAQERADEIARGDLEPFREAGADALGGNFGLARLATTEGEVAALARNPMLNELLQFERSTDGPPELMELGDPMAESEALFSGAADEAERRILNRRAAGGKLGSGGTRVDLTSALSGLRSDLANSALQRDVLRTGFNNETRQSTFGNTMDQDNLRLSDLMQRVAAKSGLINDQFNRKQAVVNIGGAAAARSANVAQNTGSQVAGLLTGSANATAAGIAGATNARTNFWKDIADVGGTLIGSGAWQSNTPPPEIRPKTGGLKN